MKLSRINDKLCVDVILAPGTHTLESSLWHEIMARVLSAKFPSMRPERRSGSKDWGHLISTSGATGFARKSGRSGIKPTTGTSIVPVCFSSDLDDPIRSDRHWLLIMSHVER